MANRSLRMEVRYHERRVGIAGAAEIDRVSAAAALSLAVTVLLSTLLVWAKESHEPLHAFMASLSGHHWTTHGIAAVALFVLLGVLIHQLGWAERLSPRQLVVTLVGSVIHRFMSR